MQKTVAAAEDRSSKWPADWKERVGWAQAEADGRCLGGCRASAAGELNRRLLMLIVFAWGAGWQSHSQSLPTINCSIPLNHIGDLPDSTRPLSTDPKSINQFLFKVSSFLNYFWIILIELVFISVRWKYFERKMNHKWMPQWLSAKPFYFLHAHTSSFHWQKSLTNCHYYRYQR